MNTLTQSVDDVNFPSAERWGKHAVWMLTCEASMSLHQLRCWNVLVVRSDDAGESWPSIKSIAEQTRIDERGVRRALIALEEDGFITRKKSGGGTNNNVYVINRPRAGEGGVNDPPAPLGKSTQGGAFSPRGDSPPLRDKLVVNSIVNLEDNSRKNKEEFNNYPMFSSGGRITPGGGNTPGVEKSPRGGVSDAAEHFAATKIQLAAPEVAPPLAAADHLHAFWQKAVGKTWECTPKRRRAWNKLLAAAGSMTRAEAAINGLARSDWHMGREPGNPTQWVEPEIILRNLDRFTDGASQALVPLGVQSLASEDPTRGKNWDELQNEMLQLYVIAVRRCVDAVDLAIDRKQLEPIESKNFDPILLPLGGFQFHDFTATVFPWWRIDINDGIRRADGVRAMAFQHSLNATAGLFAAQQMRKMYPASKAVAKITADLIASTRKDRAVEYALAVKKLREREIDEADCVDVEYDVFGENFTGAVSTSGETHAQRG